VLNSSNKVLIVDDDPVFAGYMSSLINNRLYQSVIAHSAGVLDSAALDSFRIIVLDLWLPDSFGEESLEKLIARGYSGGVILVSGAASDDLHSVGKFGVDSGLDILGVLRKPFDTASFQHLLNPNVLNC